MIHTEITPTDPLKFADKKAYADRLKAEQKRTGLTDAALKSALPAGFDPAIWGQSATINNGYPYLLDNPPE